MDPSPWPAGGYSVGQRNELSLEIYLPDSCLCQRGGTKPTDLDSPGRDSTRTADAAG